MAHFLKAEKTRIIKLNESVKSMQDHFRKFSKKNFHKNDAER